MKNLIMAKIMNVIECINIMILEDNGSELYYHPADNSIYISKFGDGMKLLKNGKDLTQNDILHYLIGFRENLCLN